MILPIPLCAFHFNGFSATDRYGQKQSVHAAFIGWKDTQEVPTEFINNGIRIGDQMGRWGAAVDEQGFDMLSIKTADLLCNCASPTCVGLPARASGGRTISCTAAWFDGDYYWVAAGSVRVYLETKTIDGVPCCRMIDNPYCGVSIHAVGRLSEDELQQVIDRYATKQSWSWRSCRRTLLQSKTDMWKYDDGGLWRPDIRDAYDASKVESVFTPAARYLVAQGTTDGSVMSAQPVYPIAGFDPYPQLKAIPTLLNTYAFSDPQLALGQVGRTTHYETRAVSDRSVWDRAKHRKPTSKTVDTLVLRGGPYGTYLFEWLVQHAWMDAANSIPQANQNSIQNLMAAFELLASLKSGNVAEIPDILYDEWVAWTTSAKAYAKGVSNLWLRYRYELTTTRMDIDEYVKFGLNIVDKYMQQITSSRTHGSATYHDGDSTYKCNCSMTWSEKGLTGLSKFFHTLWSTGLEPNAYVLWDFVPFSFVVDWFTPAGDVFETYSSKQYRNSAYYDFSDIVFSIRYSTGPIAGLTASHYVRWVATEPPIVDESYWFDDGGSTTGSTTIVKRILDSGSLMTGMFVK